MFGARSRAAEAAIDEARGRRGTWFDPALVDALVALGPQHELWSALRSPDLRQIVFAAEPAQFSVAVDDDYLDEITAAFGEVVDSKSPYTAGHSGRVALYTDLIASDLGMSAERRRWLHRGALLHDVGKLGVSNAILDKPGKLDAAEWEAVRKHAEYTEQILQRIPQLAELAVVAAAHHERLDGKGYPRGVAASITRAARIITTADIFDAITAARPYRGAMPTEKALSILCEERGTGLCPTAVDAIAVAAGRPPGVDDGLRRFPLDAPGSTRPSPPLSARRAARSSPSIASVQVMVRLFAGLRERAGTDRLEVELPEGARVSDVLAAMASTAVGSCGRASASWRSTASTPAPTSPCALATRSRSCRRSAGASGAVRRVRVTGDPLDLAALADAVRDPRAGAVVLFEGVTREVPELDYEAYAEMATTKIEAIAAEEAGRHGLCAVAVEHRIGTVARSEPSVIVAASAPHRGEAFAGARALIDRVKAEAPIWKVEVSEAGRRRVEGTLPPT